MHLCFSHQYLWPPLAKLLKNRKILSLFIPNVCSYIEVMYLTGVHRVLVGKPEGKRPLERPRRRWEDNIKMDLQEVGGGGD